MIRVNPQAISWLWNLAWFLSEPTAHMLNSSVHLMQDVSTWGIKLEALKLVQTFVQFFSKLVGPYLPPLMAQAWQLFVGSQPVYQHLVINNAPELDADQVFTQCLFLLPHLLLLVLTANAYRRHMSGLLDSCKRASVNQLVQAPVLEVLNRSKSSDLSTFAVQLVLAPRVASPRSLPLLLVQQDKSILHHWHVSQACLCPMQADEEGDNMDFESLMSQLFEVLITLVGNQRHHHLMQPIVPELIYLTIGNNSPLVFCLVDIQALVLKWQKTECRSHAASKFRVSISMPCRLSSLSLNFNFV